MNFLFNVSNRTLGAISTIGLTACVWISYELQLKKYENLRHTDCYKEAISALTTDKGALKYLGHPIKEGKIILKSVNELEDKTRVSEVTVDVAGPKSTGIMYFWVNQKPDNLGNATLSEVQLQIGKDKNKRLVVKEFS